MALDGTPFLALTLCEAAVALSHGDISNRLDDTLQAHLKSEGGGYGYGYIHGVFGDDESGDVVYSHNGTLKKAPYEMGEIDGKPTASIDHAKAKKVYAQVTYPEAPTDADFDQHIASMESEKLYKPGTDIRLAERFISKPKRESMDKSDFAGKGTSFPIETEEDYHNAIRALGRAGSENYSASTIRKRADAIAKRKGFAVIQSKESTSSGVSASPGSRGNSDISRSGVVQESGNRTGDRSTSSGVGMGSAISQDASHSIKLKESVTFPVDIELREAFKPSYNIKLIAPGKGSSAFYPAEVLKRDGPNVFKAGTPMRIDHPTRAEEAARPEGSVKDWGAVLESDAVWHDNHAQGPGLYGRIKPFSDFAGLIDEKGPYAGVSIRANGSAVMESGKPKLRDGVPILKELTAAEGVDMVTRAGAGGMFLRESARTDQTNTEGQVEMTEAEKTEVQKLIEAAVGTAVTAATTPLKERALRGDATVAGMRALKGVSLSESQKDYIVANVLRDPIPNNAGVLDEVKLGELIMGEARRFGATLPNGSKVTGLGAVSAEEAKKMACKTCDGKGEDSDGEDCEDCGGTGKMKPKESRRKAAPDTEAIELFEALGMDKNQAARAARGRI